MFDAIKTWKSNFLKVRVFFGPEVTRLFYYAIASGVFLFLAESSFIFIIQGFLYAIGISQAGALHLPLWYPRGIIANLTILTIFGAIRAFAYFLKAYMSQMGVHIFQNVQRKKIISYTLEHAFEISTHEAVRLFTETVARATTTIQSALTVVLTLTTSIFLFALGVKLAPLEMLVGISFLGILALPLKKYDALITHAAEGLRNEWVEVNSTLLNGIRNAFFLNIYGLVPAETKRAVTSLDKFFMHHKRYTFSYAIKLALPIALGVLVISLVSYFSLTYFHTDGMALLSFFYIFIRFVQSGSESFSGLGEIKLMSGFIRDLYDWQAKINVKSHPATSSQAVDGENDSKMSKALEKEGISIQFDNVCFRYDDNPWLINGLNFSLKKGECLLIAGESGSGKSTLLSLILGINKPTSGQININDFHVDQIRNLLFKEIGYVGPEPYLLAGTVLENLLYGNPKAGKISKDQIYDALRAANGYDFVKGLPEGENTFLTEYAKLSTGQKQRLAIARALLRQPQILVLDECTANLDYINESEIIKALSDLKNKLTMIVVTHRPAFKAIATKIIELPQH